MIAATINWSIQNRFMVLVITFIITGWGIYSVKNIPLDAIPDLSDVQVIVKTSFPGQAPRVVEDQVTYPLTTAMLSVPKATNVRGYSFFGDSYVYVIFEDGTDPYWARSRVLEYLSQVASNLPANAKPTLGPDATGVGWVYEYALVDRTGKNDLSQLRSLQDWFLKYELQTVAGVSEVATIGGMVKQYQVVLDPNKLRAYNLPIAKIKMAIKRANQETGGSVIEMAEAEYMVRATGYIDSIQDLREIPLGMNKNGSPILLKDIADIRLGPQMRRGIAELDGEGEVVGGIIIMRYGENALKTIAGVKAKLEELKLGLPEGVEIVETYNRSSLIQRAVDTLNMKLVEEFIVVALVCVVFLFHMRSALVAILSLPVGILVAFIIMQSQGMNANIMSLGGIAIAIGAMVDAAIVMIENMHKHIEHEGLTDENRWQIVAKSASEVGPALFFSLIIITLSFLPVFTLEAQEGKLFAPLAFTKTFAMMAGAILSITLVPILMLYFVKGKILSEDKNPLNRFFVWIYTPIIIYGLKIKYLIMVAVVVSLWFIYPVYTGLKWEFMPPLNEQTVMYMPVTPYGISVDQSKILTQKTDAIIKAFPVVDIVFGKGGRANSATDPAPLGMIETIITFKPQSEWREGLTHEKLMEELEDSLQVPGLINSWTYPIRGRIDMLLSGIRTPLGIKLYGKDEAGLQKYGKEIESVLRGYGKTLSVFADQASAGYYLDIDIDEEKIARYKITKNYLLEYVSSAVGGMKISTMYKGIERYPIELRYEEEERRSIDSIKNIMIKTKLGFVPLESFAKVEYRESDSVITSEMASPVTCVYITQQVGVSASEYKQEAKELLKSIQLTAGYYIQWAGQSEYLDSAMAKITWIVPAVLVVILVLIYFALKELVPTLIVFFTLPFALLGGLIYIDILNFNMSIAVVVGFLALLGVAAETAIVMIVYLQEAVDEAKEKFKENFGRKELTDAIYEGAVARVRPKLMTVFAILAGLLPIMYNVGVGSEVMQRIAAPMIGGVVSSAVLSLIIIPILFDTYVRKGLKF